MTRKHFEAVAGVLLSNYQRASLAERYRLEVLVDELCVVFKEENPRFNPDRFALACGMDI